MCHHIKTDKAAQGGQAQYIRIPYADFNALKLPPGSEHEADFSLLADIFPTGWHGLELSGFKPGDTVAVFGAGTYLIEVNPYMLTHRQRSSWLDGCV